MKKYIFGYGSLVCPDDVFRTLGRRVELVYPVRLNGWIRDWSVVIDNTVARHRRVELEDGQATSVYIAVLNIRRPNLGEQPTHPNGVLFEVTDEDLVKMDERESHYRRLDVTADVVNGSTGIIYTYSGLEKFLYTPQLKGQVVIPGPYHDLVAQGFTALGPEMHGTYGQSTLVSDLPIHPAV